MGKEDAFLDFKQEILKMRQERLNQVEPNDGQDRSVIERVKSIVNPVLKAFVGTDPALEIQSKGRRDIYLAYAHIRLCGLSIAATGSASIRITLTADSIADCIYTGELNPKEIQEAVKNALIAWYKTLQ